MRLQLLCLAMLIAAPGLRAEEEVRSVQEELRRRNLYFGDIDGRRTPELEQAVKRYQKKKGFSTSGREDRETLRSLGLVQRAPDEPLPKAVEWPSEPVLKSDAVIDVDREAVRIAEETGVAPEAVGAGATTELPAATTTRGKVRQVALKRNGSRIAAVQPTATSASASGSTPGRRLSRSKRGQDQQVQPGEIREYVNEYLRAMSRGKVDEELEFYADRVAYYRNGVIDRRIVERTLRDYYKRWPKRSYKLGPAVEFARRPESGEILVVFRVDFSLKNGRRKVEGQTVNQFIINAATSDPRIVSVREERVRS
ncbi:MAG TPA: peptidoglycan-binding domain-containing protein [Chthoniobacteraceae bacterium]